MATFKKDNDLRTVANALLSQSTDDAYKGLAESHNTQVDGGVDGGIKAPGVLSMFNAFNVFRYSKFGLNTETYISNGHFDAPSDSSPIDSLKFIDIPRGTVADSNASFKTFKSERSTIENPTASTIIEWSKKFGTTEDNNYRTPTPYSSSDFLWCKYYGKVPNNRLVTLRRYPIPVEDNIANINKDKSPLVPLAQAVTWYGKDIENDLSKILNIKWGFKWEPRTAKVQDVTGNEIAVDDLLSEFGLLQSKDPALYNVIKSQLFGKGDSIGLAELAGFDVPMQRYIREAYSPEGPYWNRVLGPVNVVDSTLIRTAGFGYMDDLEIKFDYSLRSYGNINPKIAFLDLLTNFLSLTYNTAPFWGGAIRYFTKTGLKLSPLGMEEQILNMDMPGAINSGIEAISQQVKSNLSKYKNIIDGAIKAYEDPKAYNKGLEDATSARGKQSIDDIASTLLAGKLGKFMQSPLSYRSLLDGRAIGEWHVTIGNPMSPIAMIGNLVVDSVDMTVGETLGLDDFPTEFSFKVKLKHGRPRAKQDIESMFNLGNGFMSTSALAPPSSAMNSLGEYNINKSKDLDSAFSSTQGADGKIVKTKIAVNDQYYNDRQGVLATDLGANNDPKSVMPAGTRDSVKRLYGDVYGNSGALPSYFKNYLTKD